MTTHNICFRGDTRKRYTFCLKKNRLIWSYGTDILELGYKIVPCLFYVEIVLLMILATWSPDDCFK